jgi:hypothetical protein
MLLLNIARTSNINYANSLEDLITPYSTYMKTLNKKYIKDKIDINGVFISPTLYVPEISQMYDITLDYSYKSDFYGACDNAEQFLNYFNNLKLKGNFLLLLSPWSKNERDIWDLYKMSNYIGNMEIDNELICNKDVDIIFKFRIYEFRIEG